MTTTQQDEPARLSRPDQPLSPLAASALRWRERIASIPPRKATATLLAIAVGVSTFSIIRSAQSQRTRWGDSLPVLVAISDLEAGSPLNPTNTELRAIPLALVPTNAITDDTEGRIASGPIGRHQPIVAAQVDFDRHGLGPGARAITLPTPLAPPSLERGDHVDLISVRALTDSVRTDVIGRAIVVEIDEDGITVIADQVLVGPIFSALGSGSVEFARRPVER